MSAPGMSMGLSLADAARRIGGIRDALGETALRLAYHAALPVVVDAELLNLLRVNFFLDPPDDLPYEVEASLLLSPLFREIGEGLYEIEPGLRNLLLSALQRDYGDERVCRVAALLEQYTDASVAWRGLPELEAAQRLTAVSFLDPPLADQWLSGVGPGADTHLDREWYIAMRRRIDEQSAVPPISSVVILRLSGLHVGEAEQVANTLLELRTGPRYLRNLLVLDDTSLLVPHGPVYERLDTAGPVGDMLCVAVGPRAGNGRVLRLPGNLGGVQGLPVLWVSDPSGIDWRASGAAIAMGHPPSKASGLDHLVELLSIEEVFKSVHKTVIDKVPGRVANPGLRLVGADDEAATFALPLAIAVRRLCEPRLGSDAPFPALLPAQVGGATLTDVGSLAHYSARIAVLVDEASDALGKLTGLGGLLRRGDNRARLYIVEAGATLAVLRDLVAQLLRYADAVGELTGNQRGLVSDVGIRFPSGSPPPNPGLTGGSAAEQSPVYRTIAGVIRGGDTLALVSRRLMLTERELERHGSASYLYAVEDCCPPSLLKRLADPPREFPRRPAAAARRELGLDDAMRAADALLNLVVAVANREWSPAVASAGEVAGIRAALDGVGKALTERVGTAASFGGGRVQDAPLVRLGESLTPALRDLVLRVLAAEVGQPSTDGQEAFRTARERTAALLAEWTRHVESHGVRSLPPFATSRVPDAVRYTDDDDMADIREALLYPPAQEMWQLCAPQDLSALNGSAVPEVVRFASRLDKDALAGKLRGEQPVWTSSGSYAGLLRLVSLRSGVVSSSQGELWPASSHTAARWRRR